jgi:hypothetical protein
MSGLTSDDVEIWRRAAFLSRVAYSGSAVHFDDDEPVPGCSALRFRFSNWTFLADEDTDAQATCCYDKQDGVCWVAFRGTQTPEDIMCDAYTFQSHSRSLCDARPETSSVRVHSGFSLQYQSLRPKVDKFVAEHVSTNLRHSKSTRVYVTGHSLGAALAMLYATGLKAGAADVRGVEAVECFALGCPRVGNRAFAKFVERLTRAEEPMRFRVRRLVLGRDPVTDIPCIGYVHAGEAIRISRTGADATTDFRVFRCWWPLLYCDFSDHDLGAYLHAVCTRREQSGVASPRTHASSRRAILTRVLSS